MRDDLFEPLARRRIIEAGCSFLVAVQMEKCDTSDIASALIPVHKRVVQRDARHVQRRLRDDVCAFIKGRMLWALQGAFEERAVAEWSRWLSCRREDSAVQRYDFADSEIDRWSLGCHASDP